MNICGRYHNEIVYQTKKCPLCGAMNEIEVLKTALEDQKLEAAGEL